GEEERWVGCGDGCAGGHEAEGGGHWGLAYCLTSQRLRHVIVVRGRGAVVLSGDVKCHTANSGGRGETDREGESGRTGVTFVRRDVIDRKRGRRACAYRRKREIVNGQAVIGAGSVEIEPPNEKRRAIGDAQPRDRKTDRGAIGGRVSIERSGRAGGDRAGKIELIDIRPGSGRKTGSICAVLEINPVGAPRRSQSPLLAGVTDLEAGNRRACIVGE